MPPKTPVRKGKKQLTQLAIYQSAKLRKSKKKRRPRATEMELSERRQMIVRMRLKGKSFRDIGKELGIGYMTVQRDIQAVAVENQKKISNFNREYAIADCMGTYDQIVQEAWEQYHKCSIGTSQKAQFLNLVRVAKADQVKILTEVGLISKAPQKVEHKLETDGVLKGWTNEAKQLVALAIIRSQIGGGVAKEAVPEALSEGNGQNQKLLDIPPEMVEVKKPE